MGVDIAFDGLSQIRRILNILSILEESSEELSSKEIRKRLTNYEKVSSGNRQIIRTFVKDIEKWEEENVGVDIIKANYYRTKDNRKKGPYKFSLNNGPTESQIYKECLRVAFAMLIVKKGQLGFIDAFSTKSKPLTMFMKIINSIKHNHTAEFINISYEEGITKNKVCVKLFSVCYIDKNIPGKWALECRDKENNEITIPLLKIISVS